VIRYRFVAGFAADVLWGDPARLHPVAGFGRLAARAERALYAPSRGRGAIYASSLIALAAVAGDALARIARRAGAGRGASTALALWAALGGRSLRREAARVAATLDRGSLGPARAALPALVGRDTQDLTEPEICSAVVESVGENTADAVVGPLVWGVLAGPAGVAAYRAANTLDAMVGHRSDRYEAFGWAAARLDDLMSWPAARAAALLTAATAPVVGGSARLTWRTARRDGRTHPSPNAGRMEAAFAGALGVRLGGPLRYGGRLEQRPSLGSGRRPTTRDIRRANRLSLAVGAAAATACSLAGVRR
jgi:adenosylcobinamide-phosphate synthase